jgi:N-methylhydantoinase A
VTLILARYRVGIDIGGTFTDLVAFDEDTKKLLRFKCLTNPNAPEESFIQAIKGAGMAFNKIKVLIHATTLGTNMFFGQTGIMRPKVLLITNKGFRDIIEIGRQNRPQLYNLFFTKPEPLVPRNLRIGVRGRIGPSGEELEKLDVDEIKEIAQKYSSEIDVFVISFLHSYINPIHEKRAKEIISRECSEAIVMTSHEVDPEPKEYERTSTALINAILKPILSSYLKRLGHMLDANRFKGKFLVMRSDGGVSDSDIAVKKPAAFIESGPAAGAVAVSYMSKIMGLDKVLGLDMGGTTAKASAIINGEPDLVSEYEVGGTVHMGRPVRGSGYPIRISHIDLAEVSAGGGTIAWVDVGGALRVGPMSAGAKPGPACYGLGGKDPTITDANFLLGRLSEELAGGAIKLRKNLAYEAIKKLGNKLAMDPIEVASGIIEIANHVMSRALRLVSIERGHDPREFKLFAFGGAGPLHAVALMEIGIKEVIIPMLPGVFSAFGLLTTDYKHDYVSSIVKRASELDDEDLQSLFNEMERRAVNDLISEGIKEGDIKLFRVLEMRYWGQAYELRVYYKGKISECVNEFHNLHENRYGYKMMEEEVEVITARLEAVGITSKPRIPTYSATDYIPRPHIKREVYLDGEWRNTDIYIREMLKPGACILGPAIIEEDESTILIPQGYICRIDGFRNICIKEEGHDV